LELLNKFTRGLIGSRGTSYTHIRRIVNWRDLIMSQENYFELERLNKVQEKYFEVEELNTLTGNIFLKSVTIY
jgi:hypothetical protein